MLCAWTLGACGARTGPDGRGPDGGGGSAPDAGADAGAQLACDALPTSSEPIVAPPACELAWASCRPVVTSALLIPAPCGQLPTAVWTGEAILVGYDATAETRIRGAAVATVGVDGRLRRDVEVVLTHGMGRAVGLAWSDAARVALFAGAHEIVWLDPRGVPLARPVPHGASGPPARVEAVADATGFSLGRIDGGLWTAHTVGPSSPAPAWARVDEDAQSFAFLRDARGLRRGIASARSESTRVAPDGAAARSVAHGGARHVGAAAAIADRFVIGEIHPDGAGFWIHDLPGEGAAAISTLVSDEPSPWGLDIIAMDDEWLLVAAPFRVGGALRIGLYAMSELGGPPRFLVGREGSPRQPSLVRLPNGFAIVYFEGRSGIAIDVFECCAR